MIIAERLDETLLSSPPFFQTTPWVMKPIVVDDVDLDLDTASAMSHKDELPPIDDASSSGPGTGTDTAKTAT